MVSMWRDARLLASIVPDFGAKATDMGCRQPESGGKYTSLCHKRNITWSEHSPARDDDRMVKIRAGGGCKGGERDGTRVTCLFFELETLSLVLVLQIVLFYLNAFKGLDGLLCTIRQTLDVARALS